MCLSVLCSVCASVIYHNESDKLSVVLFIALTMMVCIVAPLSGEDCSEARCLKAFDNFKKHRSFIILDDVLPSWNMTQLQQLCVLVYSMATCAILFYLLD